MLLLCFVCFDRVYALSVVSASSVLLYAMIVVLFCLFRSCACYMLLFGVCVLIVVVVVCWLVFCCLIVLRCRVCVISYLRCCMM